MICVPLISAGVLVSIVANLYCSVLVRHALTWPALAAVLAVVAVVAQCLRLSRSSKPVTTSKPPSGQFDFIICGGGLAGSVLAARLSEDPTKRVLVVEPGTASPNGLFIRISGAILKLFRNPAVDWCWQTVAEASCLGRRIFLCRGRVLGGSTCLNAQLAFRGSPSDYDNWGVTGWAAEDLAPCFDQVEPTLTSILVLTLTAKHITRSIWARWS